ncbi:unnamed protein product, partial [Durusdinium trenchii]
MKPQSCPPRSASSADSGGQGGSGRQVDQVEANGHCVATFQSWEWHDPRLTYAWQQTDTEIKVYISFDQSEDHLQELQNVKESQVKAAFGEWSATVLIELGGRPFGLRLNDFHRRLAPEKCSWALRSSRITLKRLGEGPSSTMASGSFETTACDPINSGYTGSITVSCFFGVLEANPAACSAKPCAAGDPVTVTLDGVSETLNLASELASGLNRVAFCTDVNSAWGGQLTLSCSMGSLSFDVSTCQKACATSDTLTLALGALSSTVSPSNRLLSGETEYNR